MGVPVRVGLRARVPTRSGPAPCLDCRLQLTLVSRRRSRLFAPSEAREVLPVRGRARRHFSIARLGPGSERSTERRLFAVTLLLPILESPVTAGRPRPGLPLPRRRAL